MQYDFNKYKKPLFAAGVYPFEIVYSNINSVSKQGNACLEIKIEIINGSQKSVLKEMIPWELIFKIEHLCKSIGKSDIYKAGLISNQDLLGYKGFVELFIDNYKGSESNKVKDYIVKDEADNLEDKSIDDELPPF